MQLETTPVTGSDLQVGPSIQYTIRALYALNTWTSIAVSAEAGYLELDSASSKVSSTLPSALNRGDGEAIGVSLCAFTEA